MGLSRTYHILTVNLDDLTPTVEASARMRNTELHNIPHGDIDPLRHLDKGMLIIQAFQAQAIMRNLQWPAVPMNADDHRQTLIERQMPHARADDGQPGFGAGQHIGPDPECGTKLVCQLHDTGTAACLQSRSAPFIDPVIVKDERARSQDHVRVSDLARYGRQCLCHHIEIKRSAS